MICLAVSVALVRLVWVKGRIELEPQGKSPAAAYPEVPPAEEDPPQNMMQQRRSARQPIQPPSQKEPETAISEEMSGWLTEDEIPADFDWSNRLYLGTGTYYLIDMDNNLVRWGNNFDNTDIGWDCIDSQPQPFVLRNVLVPHAKKMVALSAPELFWMSMEIYGVGDCHLSRVWAGTKTLPIGRRIRMFSAVRQR